MSKYYENDNNENLIYAIYGISSIETYGGYENPKEDVRKDTYVKEIETLFNKYNFTFRIVDTELGQFNLDKEWLESESPILSESEYAFTVPKVFTKEEKQKLIDYYDSGKILITIGYAIDYDITTFTDVQKELNREPFRFFMIIELA